MEGHPPEKDQVLLDKHETSAFIVLNIPQRRNVISESVMTELSACMETAEKDPEIKNLIFMGAGKSFSVGADVGFFVERLKEDNIDRIYEYTEFGHKVFERVTNSDKKTLAYIDGAALGGGLELALCCDYRVGTSRSLFSFPETGLGIYPGWGGTQRTTRLLGKGLAKFLIATGERLNAKRALSFGLLDRIVDRIEGPEDFEELCASLECLDKSNEPLPEKYFADFNGELTAELFKESVFSEYQKVLKSRAPLGLKKAMEIIDEGICMDLSEALKLELKWLRWIFSKEDTMRGLSCCLTGEKPVFTGE